MKAVYFETYGSADQLSIRDLPKPEPKADEVLIRNRASSINFGNAAHIKGKPLLIRAYTGLRKTRFNTPGGDIAGIVEAVGSQVEKFRPGDEVMADSSDSGFGAYAEYVTVRETVVVSKPETLSFEEAATLPLAASVALAGIRRTGNVQTSQQVLIVGSTGSVGTFAVQVAKAFGAEVTAVCSGRHTEFVRSLGADHVVDYLKVDFTKMGRKYDLVAGIAGSRAIRDYMKVLKTAATYVNIGGSMKQFRSAFTTGPFLSMFSRKKFKMLMYRANKEDLLRVKELVEAGRINPVVARTFPLDQIVDAYQYYESGQGSAGKIVIAIPGHELH
jgi:NADPH:quinone reductase-like Zn-dependent oxidoreductase